MLEYGQRLKHQQRAQLADESGLGNVLWQTLAQGGALATGFECGAIAAGNIADLVVIGEAAADKRGIALENIMDSLVINGDSNDVTDVYVAGQRKIGAGVHGMQELAAQEYVDAVRDLLGKE